MEYKAVVKRKSDDELQHWKYIKRVKKNGKWQYTYDSKDNKLTSLKKEANRTRGALDAHYNVYRNNLYKQDMRDAMANIKNNPDGPKNVKYWYNRTQDPESHKEVYPGGGDLRYQARDAKNDYERYKDTVSGKIDAVMEKHGENIAEKLNKPNKYIKRVKGKDGKYRYIYDVKDALGVDERKSLVNESNNYKFKREASKHYKDKLTRELYDKDPYKYYEIFDKYWRLQKRAERAERRVADALEKYGKTPLGKIETLFRKKKMTNHFRWL